MTEGPWSAVRAENMAGKLHAPATLRNRDAIAAILAQELPPSGLVLEVASGSGEHVIHFAGLFPRLDWQPTDPDPVALGSITAWSEEARLPNLRAPLALDAASAIWPITQADALLCINMTHISPWESTLGLFAGAARLLAKGAPLILYGPFLQAGVATVPSNLVFDAQLRERDPRHGLRAVEDLDQVSERYGLARTGLYAMPANNLALVYRVK